MGVIVKVCIPHTMRDAYDYYGNTLTEIGIRVLVPFRKQNRIGIVVGYTETAKIPLGKIKPIISALDSSPFLTNEILELCRWVSRYYQSPLSEVIALAIPKKLRQGKPDEIPKTPYYQLAVTADAAHQLIRASAKKQQALVNFLAKENSPISKKKVLEQGFQLTQIQTLLKLKILIAHEQFEPIEVNTLVLAEAMPHTLTDEQEIVIGKILAQLHTYHCFLLHGITGSGKTEVYMQVAAKMLALGKQVLILVPEIGLTPQLLTRFSNRFQQPMAILHSNLSDGERSTAWLSAREGMARLIIGTRTAIFTPMADLGLIIIDEEHDPSFKQMEGVRYSARDTALIRAYQQNIPIILGSATPSLESLHNCEQKKYTLLSLNQKAITSASLHYQILDIRNQYLKHGLSIQALEAIKTHLHQGNQVLIFINRRGFAPVILCHQCGWMADCQACDSHLTLHRKIGKLICHHCGLMQKIPTSCQNCHAPELLPIGAGTQRIQEFLMTQFPNTSILRTDRDEVSQKDAFHEHLARINSGDVQLIVGTQMLAKGHHFPKLTLVVVIDTDAGFYNQDFRALERLGQLLTQVAGRAGRAELPGEVLIQTHLPQHPLLNLLIQEGYHAFAQSLLTLRQQAQLPPYQHLAVIRAQGKTPAKVLEFLEGIRIKLNVEHLALFGPAPSPLAKKAGTFRMQLLVKSHNRKILQEALTQTRGWLAQNHFGSNIRWNIDVDPADLS